MKSLAFFLLCCMFAVSKAYVDYSGHKVLTVTPKSEKQLELLYKLREDYSVDLWNEPRFVNAPVMVRLRPLLIEPVEQILKEQGLEYEVAFSNLQSAIEAEKVLYGPTNISRASEYNFGKYHQYEVVVQLLQDLSSKYSNIAKLEVIGQSYENRPLYNMKISSGDSSSKPVILMECGIHAREWSSVAAGAYIVNKLITSYGSDSEITALVDKYEFNIIVEMNPDGYIYTWKQDRLWRKTRSRSSIDWLGVCLGADANRNFDIDHCGAGTSRKPCDEIYCGDKPFSESETRALRDIMIAKKDRVSVYFAIHAYSQYWMTPYGIKKSLPSNYDELVRVGRAGVNALAKRYGTQYKLGSIANIIYEAAGSSLDYIYEKLQVKMGFALELRDNGRHGFILPQRDILPMCEETWDGIKAAIEAL